MVSIGRLYGPANNGRINKPLITAKLSGIEIDYDSNFKFGVDNKTEEYLSKFPLGQTPAFESKDGLLLTESDAIAFYIASQKENNTLLGADKNEYAKILQYSFYVSTQITPSFLDLYLPILGFAPYDAKKEEGAYSRIDRALGYLDSQLKGKTYLVGNQVTVADVILFTGVDGLYSKFYAKEHRDKFPNFTKYFDGISQLSEVKEVIGEYKYAQERPNLAPKA
ncbi:glutathione S-transferase [Neoconidiobolus thromboides FSU 785]|nr:glutathione S-transferase [Neoconidiobolus thromboides FSU 785]